MWSRGPARSRRGCGCRPARRSDPDIAPGPHQYSSGPITRLTGSRSGWRSDWLGRYRWCRRSRWGRYSRGLPGGRDHKPRSGFLPARRGHAHTVVPPRPERARTTSTNRPQSAASGNPAAGFAVLISSVIRVHSCGAATVQRPSGTPHAGPPRLVASNLG